MQTKTTHIQDRRNAAEAAKQQVTAAIGIGHMAYNWRMYLNGLTYLEHYVRDRQDIDRFERSRIFWNWWKIQWTIREEEFMTYAINYPLPQRFFFWCKLHDPLLLAQERTPNGEILGNSWCVMIGNMRKEEAKKAADMKWVDAVLDGINDAE